MTFLELLKQGEKYLSNKDAIFLLTETVNKKKEDIFFSLNEKVSPKDVDNYLEKLKEIENGKPLQYVIGHVNFYGNKIYIDENVLIPRFETEELVERAIDYIRSFDRDNIRILDLCCGSGAIGLSIKKALPYSDVYLSDISLDALNIVRKNAANLELEVTIIESDLFDKINKTFDVILCNPPYIRDDEVIDELVKNNEPSIALYGGIDGLDFYRNIIKEAGKHLNINYLVGMEIGYLQKKAIVKLIEDNFSEIDIDSYKDLSGRDRLVFFYNRELK